MLCIVSKIVVIGTPSAFAFSRSTSMLYCGTPVLKVVDTPASSGRWLAAWITRWAAWARLSRLPPERSWR